MKVLKFIMIIVLLYQGLFDVSFAAKNCFQGLVDCICCREHSARVYSLPTGVAAEDAAVMTDETFLSHQAIPAVRVFTPPVSCPKGRPSDFLRVPCHSLPAEATYGVADADVVPAAVCREGNRVIVDEADDTGKNCFFDAINQSIATGNFSLVLRMLKQENAAEIINSKNRLGQTGLHVALEQRCDFLVQILLRYPFLKINAQDNNGLTALHYAVKSKNSNLIQLLLAFAGVDVTICCKRGRTPLHVACMFQFFDLRCFSILVRCYDCSSINIIDSFGFSALDYFYLAGKSCLYFADVLWLFESKNGLRSSHILAGEHSGVV